MRMGVEQIENKKYITTLHSVFFYKVAFLEQSRSTPYTLSYTLDRLIPFLDLLAPSKCMLNDLTDSDMTPLKPHHH